jgi:transmembrane sensor
MDQHKIIDLYLRCRDQKATAAEQETFRLLLMDPDAENILHEFWNEYWPEGSSYESSVQIEHYEQIFDYIITQPKFKVKKRRLWPGMAAAAALVIVAGTGWFYMQQSHRKQMDGKAQAEALSRIVPGRNKAYLTLADGKRIVLTDAVNGTLAKQSGVQITKTAGGKLIYTVLPQKAGAASLAGSHNTIETPKGGQYQINLPDGSIVWLNADSKLSYPVSFAAKRERIVELTGEAYFEVTKDKSHPFKVKSGEQEIEVLGTHFNINCYQDEQVTKTTLLEGTVKVSLNSGKLESLILKPGQQSVLTNSKLQVKSVDVNDVMDWKNGEFIFDNEPLPGIMRKVSRWYNVEVEYRNPNARLNTFTGSVSKSDKITSILKMLQKTSKIRFTVEGSKIIID